MSEKIVRSFEIIETDDGFRIEIKGEDKEQLRKLLFGKRNNRFMPFPFGGRGRGRGRGKHFGRRHMRRGFGMPMPPTPPMAPEAYAAAPPQSFRRGRGQGRGRGFGGRWEARWGYDLGPWWDAGEPGDAGEEKPKNSEA